MIHSPSPNFDARKSDANVDMLVLHYTGMRDGHVALERLRDPATKVSAHYMIEEEGTVYALVDEELRAWHAGVSCWAGQRDINGCSIGIELVNPGHEFGYRPFPAKQRDALVVLAEDIVSRHAIPAHRVLGHSDVAPARKQDPGELFDWAGLARAGIGMWPEQGTEDPVLEEFGYDVTGAGQAACATAFQRHWRPGKIDGFMDDECIRLLAGLLDRMHR